MQHILKESMLYLRWTGFLLVMLYTKPKHLYLVVKFVYWIIQWSPYFAANWNHLELFFLNLNTWVSTSKYYLIGMDVAWASKVKCAVKSENHRHNLWSVSNPGLARCMYIGEGGCQVSQKSSIISKVYKLRHLEQAAFLICDGGTQVCSLWPYLSRWWDI